MGHSHLKPISTKQMTTTEAAWLAGFFDGEGTIGYWKGGKSRKFISAWGLSIANTHLESLEHCRRITGVGSISEKPKTIELGHKRAWRWQVHSQRNIMNLLEQMLPYLVTKQVASANALALWGMRQS